LETCTSAFEEFSQNFAQKIASVVEKSQHDAIDVEHISSGRDHRTIPITAATQKRSNHSPRPKQEKVTHQKAALEENEEYQNDLQTLFSRLQKWDKKGSLETALNELSIPAPTPCLREVVAEGVSGSKDQDRLSSPSQSATDSTSSSSSSSESSSSDSDSTSSSSAETSDSESSSDESAPEELPTRVEPAKAKAASPYQSEPEAKLKACDVQLKPIVEFPILVTAVDCTEFPPVECEASAARLALMQGKGKTRRGTRVRGKKRKLGTDENTKHNNNSKECNNAILDTSALLDQNFVASKEESIKDAQIDATPTCDSTRDYSKCAKLSPLMAKRVPVGTKIAFKQLEIGEDCSPQVSEYKEGNVHKQMGPMFTVQLIHNDVSQPDQKLQKKSEPSSAQEEQWVLDYETESPQRDTEDSVWKRIRPAGLLLSHVDEGEADAELSLSYDQMIDPVILVWGAPRK
jgi:hypothetical protein